MFDQATEFHRSDKKLMDSFPHSPILHLATHTLQFLDKENNGVNNGLPLRPRGFVFWNQYLKLQNIVSAISEIWTNTTSNSPMLNIWRKSVYWYRWHWLLIKKKAMVKALVLSEAMQTNCLAKRKMSYLAQNSFNL